MIELCLVAIGGMKAGVGSFYRGDWLQVGYVSHWRLCCTLGQVRTHGVAPLLHST